MQYTRKHLRYTACTSGSDGYIKYNIGMIKLKSTKTNKVNPIKEKSKIVNTIIHEYSHKGSSEESDSHGTNFNEYFRLFIDNNQNLIGDLISLELKHLDNYAIEQKIIYKNQLNPLTIKTQAGKEKIINFWNF